MRGDRTTRDWYRALPAVTIAVGSVVMGCGGSGSSLTGQPATTVDVTAGQRAYDSTCGACHGAAGRGTSKGPPLVDRIYEPSHHGDGAFSLAVTRGVPAHHWQFGDMPPQPGVSDTGITNIVAYVRALQIDAGIS